MSAPEVLVQRLPHGEGLPLPSPATAGAAGCDICSADELTLAPMDRRLLRTGFAMAVPDGYEMQVRPRSGLALRQGLTLPNTPATIDADYRGELMIAVINLGQEPVVISRGMRVAQLIVSPVLRPLYREVGALPPTDRGSGGFGSTGV